MTDVVSKAHLLTGQLHDLLIPYHDLHSLAALRLASVEQLKLIVLVTLVLWKSWQLLDPICRLMVSYNKFTHVPSTFGQMNVYIDVSEEGNNKYLSSIAYSFLHTVPTTIKVQSSSNNLFKSL